MKKIKRDIDPTMDPMLEIIPGDPREIVHNQWRKPDIKENIKSVKREFIGKPTICFELVVSIIHSRRAVDAEYHKERFYYLLDKYQDILLKELDSRWLISVCDTIVDTGNDIDSSAAMLVSLLVNSLNIQATLLDAVSATQPTKEELKKVKFRKTWDGMVSAPVTHGDMIFNMMTRLNKVVSKSIIVEPIWQEIKTRLRDDTTVPLNWLTEVHEIEQFRNFFR